MNGACAALPSIRCGPDRTPCVLELGHAGQHRSHGQTGVDIDGRAVFGDIAWDDATTLRCAS